MICLSTVEVGAVVIAEENEIEPLVIQFSHLLSSLLLPLRRRPVFDLLLNPFPQGLLLIPERRLLIGSRVNTVVPQLVLLQRFLLCVSLEADAFASALIQDHLADKAEVTLAIRPPFIIPHLFCQV